MCVCVSPNNSVSRALDLMSSQILITLDMNNSKGNFCGPDLILVVGVDVWLRPAQWNQRSSTGHVD